MTTATREADPHAAQRRHGALQAAPASPVAGSAFATSSPAHAQLLALRPRRFRALPRGPVLQAKAPPDLAGILAEQAGGTTVIDSKVVEGWVRLILPAGLAADYQATRPKAAAAGHDVALSLRVPEGTHGFSVALLAGEQGTGMLRVVLRLVRRVVAGPEAQHLRYRLEEAVGDRGFDPVDADRPIFLSLEFEGPVRLELGDFSVVPTEGPPPGVAPYYSSPLQVCINLVRLNRDLSTQGRREPAQWRRRALDIATNLDCYETAQGLLASLDGAFTPADEKNWPGHLRARANIGIATGALAQTRELLLAHLDTVLTDDRLVTMLSACLDPEPRFLPLVGRLPSGQANRFFLSRLAMDTGALALAAQAPSNEEPEQRVQRQLFVASQLREISPAASLDWLNRALAVHDLAPLTALGTGPGNVLDGLRFAPVERRRDGPLVSVIMAAYNAEQTLGYAARSVLAQSHGRLELLLCDDASTDGTAALARQLAAEDDRVHVFRSPRNQGPYNIRNAMIERAAGDYITFADADDVNHPERLARQLTALVNPPAGAEPLCVLASWFRVMPDGRIPFFRDQRATRRAVVSILGPAALFRRGRAYRPLLCGGDTDFYEALRQRHGTGFEVQLPEPLLFGLWSDSSLTRQPGLEVTEDGYRSPARLALGEICARQRLFGPDVVPEEVIEALARRHGIHRDPAGTEALEPYE